MTTLVLGMLPITANSEEPGKLYPSEAVTLMLAEAMNAPEASRKDVYEDILPRVITEDLEDDELFSLGEVYFFALMPEEARDAYYPLRHGNSMRARVAWQRLIQVRFRAFQMYEQAAKDMQYFRETFKADPADREYLSAQVRNFGNYYLGQGRHDKVVEVVEDELSALDYGGAYSSLIHPATFIESYIAAGKKPQALAHLRDARDGLAATLAGREANRPEEDYVYPLPADRYYFFYSPVNEKLGWTQKNDKFRALIAKLDEAIERVEIM